MLTLVDIVYFHCYMVFYYMHEYRKIYFLIFEFFQIFALEIKLSVDHFINVSLCVWQGFLETNTDKWENSWREHREDGGGVRWGDHQPPPKYIKNSSRYGTTPTKQCLGDSGRPQASRGTG